MTPTTSTCAKSHLISLNLLKKLRIGWGMGLLQDILSLYYIILHVYYSLVPCRSQKLLNFSHNPLSHLQPQAVKILSKATPTDPNLLLCGGIYIPNIKSSKLKLFYGDFVGNRKCYILFLYQKIITICMCVLIL